MPAVELSPEQEAEYISNRGSKCPICRSDNLEGGSLDVDGPVARVEATCLDCDAEWIDIYTLSGIEEVPSNEEEED
jgi:hypothetical protein